MTDTKEMPGEKKYFWSDDDERLQGGPFDTREEAFDDAYCHRAQCFDDPSQQEFFYLHHGVQVMNPDYCPDEGFSEDNPQYTLANDTSEKVDGLTVTDMFHTAWVKSDTAHFPAADLENERETISILKFVEAWFDRCSRDKGSLSAHRAQHEWLKKALALLERKEKT